MSSEPTASPYRFGSWAWLQATHGIPGGRAHFAEKYGAFSKIVLFFPVR